MNIITTSKLEQHFLKVRYFFGKMDYLMPCTLTKRCNTDSLFVQEMQKYSTKLQTHSTSQ